jgi:hypothetical protein
MAESFSVQILGLERLAIACSPALLRDATETLLTRAAETLRDRAKELAPPKDQSTSGLRDDIQMEVDAPAGQASVFNTLSYAPFAHGSFDGGASRTQPHWPPWGPGSQLAAWADAKGIAPYLVARAISRKGTPLIPYLKDAISDSQPALDSYAAQFLRDVGEKWGGA